MLLVNINTIIKYSLACPIIIAYYLALNPGKIVLVSIILIYPILLFYFIIFRNVKKSDFEGAAYVSLFILLNSYLLISSPFNIENLNDLGVVLSSFVPIAFLCPLAIYYGINTDIFFVILRWYIRYGVLLVFPLLYLANNSSPYGFTHQIAPISMLILLTPFLGKRFLLFLLVVSFIAVIVNPGNRSTLLNIIFPYFIILIYYITPKSKFLFIAKNLRFLLLIIPLVFGSLSLFNNFNIFSYANNINFQIYMSKSNNYKSLLVDSRSSIYEDVFFGLEKSNSLVFGLGGGGKVNTSLADNLNNEIFKEIYEKGRRSSESGMLNYIQWSGLIGGLIYYLMFIKASYLGVYKSRNFFSVIVGVWIAYKAAFSFIEDPVLITPATMFSLLLVGLCFNANFRNMSNTDLLFYLNWHLKPKYNEVFSVLRLIKK